VTAADGSIVTTRATLDDLDELAPLFDAYRVFYKQASDIATARRFIDARLREAEASALFLARRDGEAVGFTRMWRVHSSIAARPAWILEDLYVVPAVRRSGVAQTLMDRSERHARDDGAVYVALETAVDNSGAQALYESIGYERENAFYKYNLML
jgi:ribosomal protein S18 acetylase RimI-like enzyme